MKINDLLDLTDSELTAHLGLRPVAQDLTNGSPLNQRVQSSLPNVKVGAVPTTLDYRNYNGNNYVTSVKNQGSCGSCWSFAATGQYESYLAINGFNFDLSPQAALECTSFYAGRANDCSGGYFYDTFKFIEKVGSVPLATYPYISGNYGSGAGYPTTPGICTDRNRIFLGTGTTNVYYSDFSTTNGFTAAQIKATLVADGPLMIGVYANNAFMSYASGTFTGCPANAQNFINHAILLIGWTNTGWIAKNQYGTTWGNQGYIELDYTLDCGLRYLLGSVTVANKNTNVQVNMDTNYTATGNWEPAVSMSLLAFCLFALIMLTL